MKTHLPSNLRILIYPGILCLLVVNCGWGQAYVQAKQNRTVADLQVIVHKLETSDSVIDRTTVEQALEEAEVRSDAWGNPFLYATEGTSYVLVAVGRDRTLDVDDIGDYFQIEPGKNIRGKATEDIVFRDGELIFLVGK